MPGIALKNDMYILTEGGGIKQQPKLIKSYDKSKKAVFLAILQTMDELNRNNRIYPSTVMKSAIDRIRPMVKSRSFCGEMDHPNSNDEMRLTTVEYKKASHVIRDIEIRGNEIWGEIETLSVDLGEKLWGLIKDRINIGFSLRGISEGELYNQGRMIVKDPLYIITWDCVSFPSHEKAVIQEIKMEQASFLLENAYRGKQSVINFENKQYETNLFEKWISDSVKFYKSLRKK